VKYLGGKFNVHTGVGQQYRDNWDAIFKKRTKCDLCETVDGHQALCPADGSDYVYNASKKKEPETCQCSDPQIWQRLDDTDYCIKCKLPPTSDPAPSQ